MRSAWRSRSGRAPTGCRTFATPMPRECGSTASTSEDARTTGPSPLPSARDGGLAMPIPTELVLDAIGAEVAFTWHPHGEAFDLMRRCITSLPDQHDAARDLDAGRLAAHEVHPRSEPGRRRPRHIVASGFLHAIGDGGDRAAFEAADRAATAHRLRDRASPTERPAPGNPAHPPRP